MTAAHAARIIAIVLALFIGLPVPVGWTQEGGTAAPAALNGAGATFPAPLYKKWIAVYHASHPNVSIAYDAVGSGEGIKRFLAETIDFAGSDEFLPESGAAKVEAGAATIPVTAGMIVLAYNLPGVTSEIKLPRDVCADIFAGVIQRWNDPRIEAANPGIRFPARDIALVAHLDSSGTTAAFTRHLAAADPSWRSRGLGTGKLIAWPGKRCSPPAMRGSPRGSRSVKLQSAMSNTALPSASACLWSHCRTRRAGVFVAPSEAAAQLALSARVVQVNELERSVVDPAAAGTYPIVSYSWLFLYRNYRDPAKGRAVREFVEWGLGPRQQYGAEFGYVPLSPDVVALGRTLLDTVAR